ncbi:hypothetical protein ACFV23_00555 [Streptomyces sp. NPDC059627]
MTSPSMPAHVALPQRGPAGHFGGLFDDAALFPPGSASMPAAVARHAEHRAAWYGALVGAFVCADRHWQELADQLAGQGPVLTLSLVVRDMEALPGTLAAVRAHPRVRLESLELPPMAGETRPRARSGAGRAPPPAPHSPRPAVGRTSRLRCPAR